MRVKINVTKEILEKSMYCGLNRVGIGDGCAIALAVKEIFPKAYVFTQYICNTFSSVPEWTIQLPSEATNFIHQFDRLISSPEKRLDLPALSFDIDVPNEVINRIGLQELETILSKSVNLELVDRH